MRHEESPISINLKLGFNLEMSFFLLRLVKCFQDAVRVVEHLKMWETWSLEEKRRKFNAFRVHISSSSLSWLEAFCSRIVWSKVIVRVSMRLNKTKFRTFELL